MDLDDGTWLVSGGPSDPAVRGSLQEQFSALAIRAGLAGDLVANESPLDAWLNRLKKGSHFNPVDIVSDEDANERLRVVDGGWINDLCAASAAYCVVLETEAFAYEQAQRHPVAPPKEMERILSSQTVGGPRLAEWLRSEMASRGAISLNRLVNVSELDRKTITKILVGRRVRRAVLGKLALGLSTDGAPVSVSDIPTD